MGNAFLSSADFFSKLIFEKNQEYHLIVNQIGQGIGHDKMSDLILVKFDCRSYQQTTPDDKELYVCTMLSHQCCQ